MSLISKNRANFLAGRSQMAAWWYSGNKKFNQVIKVISVQDIELLKSYIPRLDLENFNLGIKKAGSEPVDQSWVLCLPTRNQSPDHRDYSNQQKCMNYTFRVETTNKANRISIKVADQLSESHFVSVLHLLY